MRNLKRALSLALASVMLFGMMVVGAGAASYPDVDENDNIEAIEVLQAVGVMIGDERGFRPDDEVNRAEMARIMADLMDLDYDYYEAIPSQFTDVTGNYGWAKGYVDACAANGIIYGRGNGVYDPGAGVTAVEAAAMMMRALGYFQNPGDTANGFEAATVSQASRINLFSGIDGNAHDALDRNQVAQLALNTLRARMVEFTGDMGFEYNGLSVGYRSEYSPRTSTQPKYNTIAESGAESTLGQEGQYYIQLGEQLYNGDLQRSRTQDGFGAPSTRWSYKNTEIGVYADGYDFMLEGTVKSSELYATVGKAVAEDYFWNVYVDGSAGWETEDSDGNAVYIFGADSNGNGDIRDEVIDNNGDDLAGTGRGTYTYIYLDNTSFNRGGIGYAGTAYVSIVNTYGAEVTKVENGKITLNDQDGSLEFETSECEEDDVVLYAKYLNSAGDWVVGYILGLAELVEGEATTVREAKYVIIDGKTYNYNATFADDTIGTDSAGANVAIYLDLQDNIVYLGEVDEITDYALVLSVGEVNSKYTGEAEYGARLMLSDGSLLNVDLDKEFTDELLDEMIDPEFLRDGEDDTEAEEVISGITPELEFLQAKLVGQVFSCSKQSNGAYELAAPNEIGKNKLNPEGDYDYETATDDIIKNGRSSIEMPDVVYVGEEIYDVDYLYANSSTIFVLNDVSDSDTTYSVYTGYENVPDVDVINPDDNGGAQTHISAYVNKGVAKLVYITDGAIKGANNVIFVVGADNVRENKNNSGESYKVYDAIVNGEATTISIKLNKNYTEIKDELGKDMIGIYTRMTVDSDGYVTRLARGDDVKCVESEGTQKLTNGVYGYKFDGDNAYEEHIAPSSKTVIGYLDEDGNLSVASNLKTDKNDQVFVVTEDGELLGIFVVEVSDKPANDAVEPKVTVSGRYVDGNKSIGVFVDGDGTEGDPYIFNVDPDVQVTLTASVSGITGVEQDASWTNESEDYAEDGKTITVWTAEEEDGEVDLTFTVTNYDVNKSGAKRAKTTVYVTLVSGAEDEDGSAGGDSSSSSDTYTLKLGGILHGPNVVNVYADGNLVGDVKYGTVLDEWYIPQGAKVKITIADGDAYTNPGTTNYEVDGVTVKIIELNSSAAHEDIIEFTMSKSFTLTVAKADEGPTVNGEEADPVVVISVYGGVEAEWTSMDGQTTKTLNATTPSITVPDTGTLKVTSVGANGTVAIGDTLVDGSVTPKIAGDGDIASSAVATAAFAVNSTITADDDITLYSANRVVLSGGSSTNSTALTYDIDDVSTTVTLDDNSGDNFIPTIAENIVVENNGSVEFSAFLVKTGTAPKHSEETGVDTLEDGDDFIITPKVTNYIAGAYQFTIVGTGVEVELDTGNVPLESGEYVSAEENISVSASSTEQVVVEGDATTVAALATDFADTPAPLTEDTSFVALTSVLVSVANGAVVKYETPETSSIYAVLAGTVTDSGGSPAAFGVKSGWKIYVEEAQATDSKDFVVEGVTSSSALGGASVGSTGTSADTSTPAFAFITVGTVALSITCP